MRGLAPSLALLLGLPALANASQIVVGLDWRQNVFVQEFWQDGKARYAIYNSRPEAIKLSVHTVTLRFKAPRADVPTMAVVDGWVTVAGGSYHVVRGLIVQPEK